MSAAQKGQSKRVPLKVGENQLVVPYVAETREDSVNHGYFDLRADPALIATVPEVQDWPELISLLTAINAPSTPFRSLGCEKSFEPYSAPNRKEVTSKLVSYVDVAFCDLDLNKHPQLFEELIGGYSVFAQPRPFAELVMFEAELSRVFYKPERVEGYCVSIWVGGLGSSEVAARAAWSTVIDALCGFFSSGWTPAPSRV